MTEAKRLAQMTLKFFGDRGGFDELFNEIGPKGMKEIATDLEEMFANTVPENPLPPKK